MTSMPKFQPSKASIAPKERALKSLRYARKAIDRLEEVLQSSDDDKIPPFVITCVARAATSLGQAVTYLGFRKRNKR